MPQTAAPRPPRRARRADRAALVGWLGAALVLAVAALARWWGLGHPNELVFDELYYVRDAASQLVHGFPTAWPEDLGPRLGPAELAVMGDSASNAVHPPLGKWLIGLGIAVFGADSGWGWRSASALAGVLTVAVTMRIAHRLFRSWPVTWLAGFLLAIDGVHLVLTRVGLLDGFLALFTTLGALLMLRDHEQLAAAWRAWFAAGRPGRAPVFWRRPWLLAAAVVFGLAAGIKWSGLYPLAAFLLLAVASDLLARHRLGVRAWAASGLLLQAPVTALLALPLALAAYLATWLGWIRTSGGWLRSWGAHHPAEGAAGLLPDWLRSLAEYHREMLAWHATLQAPHPYSSHPLSWPLGLRPTSMYYLGLGRGEDGCQIERCSEAITPIPNVLILWLGGLAVLFLAAWLLRVAVTGRGTASRLTLAAAVIVTGAAAGWLPWVLTPSRSAVFQFYTVVLSPFLCLAIAAVAAWWLRPRPGQDPGSLRSRRSCAWLLLTATVALSVFFFPLWTGMRVSFEFWNLHMWLPGWR